MTESETTKVYEPEVFPPDDNVSGKAQDPLRAAHRAERVFGPLLGGVILDFMDLATFGPLGLIVGFVVGFWICSIYKFPMKHRVIGAFLAGWYCMDPFHSFHSVGHAGGRLCSLQGVGVKRDEKRWMKGET